MSSGGGNSQTTTSGIDPEFKPFLREVLQDVTARYKSDIAEGPDQVVAGETREQQEALGAGQALGRDLSQGLSQASIERDLRNVEGRELTRNQGSLGSVRADRARQGALADRAIQIQQASDQRRGQGAQALAGVAADRQARAQARLDAPHTAAERYFGYLGSAPQQQTTSGGGGK